MLMDVRLFLAEPFVPYRRRRLPRVLPLAGLCYLLLSVGCGGAGYAPVSGTVQFDGQPLEDAKLIFEPIGDAKGNAAGNISYGRTDAEGRYTLHCPIADREGAVVGKHRVRIVTAAAPTYTEAQIAQARATLEKQETAAGGSAANVTDEMVTAFLSDRVLPTYTERLPAKYNAQTELEFVVEKGKNQADFNLTP